jgi:hypothetical protein
MYDPAGCGVVGQRLFFGDNGRIAKVAVSATKPLGQVQPEQARVAQLVPVLSVDLMLAGPAS